ncbi:MAG: phosphopantothenoylcysteine decarboxylase [Chthoniobacterales bacterium]
MKFVVTAGPTQEAIDPVRYLSNRSSGKMGYAIAEAALEASHDVTLITGPVHIPPPERATLIRIVSADDLFDAVHTAVRECDVIVMCAAVADYRPVRVSAVKLKKTTHDFSLALTPTRDVLASIAQGPRAYYVVGFAAETNEIAAHAQQKLRDKNCDMIVANDVSRNDSGMESAQNAVTIFTRDGLVKAIARADKKMIAHELMKIISDAREKSLTKKT